MQIIHGENADLAQRFLENFYRTYDANRADLANLYHEDSMLLLQGHRFLGKEAILAKLNSLPFHQSQHHITDSVVVAYDRNATADVVGEIRIDGQQDAVPFVENFTFIATPEGGYLVFRDSFRMGMHI